MKNIEQYAYPDLEVGDQDYRWCHKYAHDVVTGKIVAGKWIKLACERHLKDLLRDDVYFDVDAAKSITLWFKFVPITDGRMVGKSTSLYPWQIFLVCNIIAWKMTDTGLRKYKYAYVQVARKGGKALALDTPIMTPNGYSTMGELSIGDYVIGADGKPVRISFESEVFTDHDCYEIEFSNGEKIVADADHLWKTTASNGSIGVRKTVDLYETQLDVLQDPNHTIERKSFIGSDVQITSIKKVPTVPTKCIQVDNDDHMFLCGKTNIPTHNTTLTGGLTLYLMYKSGEFRPRAYAAATKKDQAKLLWSDAKAMIKLSRRLSSIFKPRANDILLPSLDGEFKPLASDSNSLDGLNPLVAALDECHAIKDYNLYDVLVSAFGAQDQGLMMTITTAGTILDGICKDLNSEGKSVLSGEVSYDSYFYLIYEIDAGDQWDKEENWYKANPALGYQPKLQYLQDQAIAASMSSAKKANFMTKHLNVFVSGADKWLDIDEVKACRDLTITLDKHKSKKCTVSVDRSLVNDITSFCLLFPTDDGGCECHYINILPKKAIENATKQLKNTYMKAIDKGHLQVVEGAMIRNSFLIKIMLEINEKYDIEMFGYDPYKMKELSMDAEDAGLPMVSVSQGVGNMSEPTKKLEMLIKDRLFVYDDDLFEFACANAILGATKMGNVCIYRENVQTEKIDPLIATVIALSCATLQKVETNIYESRGLA